MATATQPSVKTRVRPCGDRILVKRLEALETFTPGGVIVQSEAHKEVPNEGEVLAVGKGRLIQGIGWEDFEVKVGDRVLFGKFSGVEVPTLDGEKVLILRADEVLSVVEEE